MKTNGIGNPYGMGLPRASGGIPRDHGFNEIFEQKISGAREATTESRAHRAACLLDHGDRVLDLLDGYANELADPNNTLKDIAPLVKRIEDEVNLMEAQTKERAGDDGELARLIQELKVTANVAVLKFERGDYL